jgi:hypothetical protein
VVIVTDMLLKMILASEAIIAPVCVAVRARMAGTVFLVCQLVPNEVVETCRFGLAARILTNICVVHSFSAVLIKEACSVK